VAGSWERETAGSQRFPPRQREGYFLVGCEQCEREAHELFDDEVEWEPTA
jgi:hypothetical protein